MKERALRVTHYESIHKVVSYLLKCLSQSGRRPFLIESREKHLDSSGFDSKHHHYTVSTGGCPKYNSEQTPPSLSEVLVLSAGGR